LRPAERALLEGMLEASESNGALLQELDEVLLQGMNDGGMGSLRVWRGTHDKRLFGGVAAEAEFNDADGTLVLASIYLDREGRFYELDMWKVDFSPLKKIPPPDLVRFRAEVD